MNPEQMQSLVRSALLSVAGIGVGYLVTKGFLTQDQANQVVNAIVTLVLVGGAGALAKWGVDAHSPAAVVAAVNSSSVPGVKVVKDSAPAPQVKVTANGEIVPDPKASQ